MIRLNLALCLLFASIFSYGQSPNNAVGTSPVDVLHYKYEIELSDKTDSVFGYAWITVRFIQPADALTLDFKAPVNQRSMNVLFMNEDSLYTAGFSHKGDKLIIYPTRKIKSGDVRTYKLFIYGIPPDGLIISKNKFGKRTFFSDNWPNRASYWIPCVDDPADKATVEFLVTAPAQYRIVSNGVLVEEKKLPGDKQLSHWKEDIPLPTKIMVIAAANFAVNNQDTVQGIPVSTWVFAENQRDGFKDYAPAAEILSFFIDYIGPYPYKKLANVQSKTIFGGMENASVIFYAEESVNGKQDQHRLIAHEISHQWFGDMVTEKNFAHLWLSEGFATYMETYFMEKRFGIDKAKEMLIEDRGQAVAFSKMNNKPVVDSVSAYMELLNANSYQKGGWILHMLRRELGDSIFRNGVRLFYTVNAGKNVDTRDLQQAFEKVSGKNLSSFFNQWLYTPGIPKLDIKWKYNAGTKNIDVTVTQLQSKAFQFPLELLILSSSSKRTEKLNIKEASHTFSIPADSKPLEIKADPEINLLYEGNIRQIN